MKQLLFLVALLAGLLCSYGQNIEKIEYSIDNLVKPGDGTIISLTGEANEINTDFDIDISSLESGLHLLYVRTQNSDGVWSLPSQQSFYVVKPDTAKVASLEYRIYQTSDDYDWLSAKIEPERKTVDSTFNLSTEGLQENESYYIEMYAKNNFDSRGFSVFSNQFTYRENHSPEGKWDTLDVTVYATEFLKFEFDTLFEDEDLLYGDSLTFSLKNTGEKDVLGFSEHILNQSVTFSPEIVDTGNYEFKIYAEDITGDLDSITVSLTVKRINHAPVRVKDEITISLSETDSVKIAANTLFTDIDIEYGDALWFSVIDTATNGVSAFADWLAEDTLLLTPPVGSNGYYVFWIEATDTDNATDSVKVLLNVGNTNHAPEALFSIITKTMVENETWEMDMDTLFFDADINNGDVLNYSLNNNFTTGGDFANRVSDVIQFTPTIGDAGQYNYWIKASDMQNASDSVKIELTVNTYVGIESSQPNNKFRIVPNPNNGIFNLHLPEMMSNTFKVYMYTTEGRMVKQFKNKTEISVGNLEAGVYIINVIGRDYNISELLIIK